MKEVFTHNDGSKVYAVNLSTTVTIQADGSYYSLLMLGRDSFTGSGHIEDGQRVYPREGFQPAPTTILQCWAMFQAGQQ